MQNRARRRNLGLAAGAVAAGWVAIYGLVGWTTLYLAQPVHKDFRIFYVAAEAGLRYGWSRIYDLPTLRLLSSAFPAGQDFINTEATFVNPPLLAWLIAPLTLLSVPIAYAIWSAISLGSVVWSWHVSAPYSGLAKFTLLLAGLALWPVVDALYYGQPLLLIVGAVAGAWWLCAHDRPVAAGCVLALATALKPQAVFVVPFALLVSGRRSAFLAWAASCALLALTFAIALGPAGLESWWQALRYVQAEPKHAYFTAAYVVGIGPIAYLIEILQGALALVIAWKRRLDLDLVFAVGLVGSIASSFHLHQSDYAELILAAWLFLRTTPPVWQRLWLLAGIPCMEAVTLAMPAAQLVWDAGWLVMMLVTSVSASTRSAATRLATTESGT